MITSNMLENKMVKSTNTIELKNNTSVVLHGLKPGATIKVAADKEGVPLDKNWRRRLKDAVQDNCIVVVTAKKGSK